MNKIGRRQAVQAAAGMGVAASVPEEGTQPHAGLAVGNWEFDRQCALTAGMNPDEADCWVAIGVAAQKYFDLVRKEGNVDTRHPGEFGEMISAFHAVQNKLMARAVYRRYREAARGWGQR